MQDVDRFQIKFPAEIRQVSSRKLASLDIEYRIVLSTADQSALMLGAISADTLVNVTVEPQHD